MSEKELKELRESIEGIAEKMGLTRTEMEYRSPAQVGMTIDEIRGGLPPKPYTVTSASRGDLWDFTTRREAERFLRSIALDGRDDTYSVRENPPPTEEQRKAYIAETMRLLGQSKSPRKAAASRENGKRGGRPRRKDENENKPN